MNRRSVDYETVRKLARELPHVEEGTSYGTPALRAKGALFARLKEDGDSLVVKTDLEQRAELLAADPDTYYITDHYFAYEWVLVRLSKVHLDALRDLLRAAHRAALASRRRKK